MKKKILIILREKDLFGNHDNRGHCSWHKECGELFDFDFWGYGLGKTTLKSLTRKIDQFKPDYLYASLKKKYYVYNPLTKEEECWLPDLTSIRIPKIYVEVDTWKYSSLSPWYSQFTHLYCRCPWWNDWSNVPLFRWSIPQCSFSTMKIKRKGIYFIGHWQGKGYEKRREIEESFRDTIVFCIKHRNYWDYLHKASALICPTESDYGDFIPIKLFEYLASGAAVITNCNVEMAGIPEVKDLVIRYSNMDDLKDKLMFDFSPYHNMAVDIMRNHIHSIRYKEIFK